MNTVRHWRFSGPAGRRDGLRVGSGAVRPARWPNGRREAARSRWVT